MPIDVRVLEALGLTVAAIGCETSEGTIRTLSRLLEPYPVEWVLGALTRCQIECKYRLSLADIIERLDDGHPGPEAAWELVPKSESETAVLTQEIMDAIPFELLERDLTAARMAFRESYARGLAQARAERRAPKWFASLGHDQRGREAPLLRSVQLGRLPAEQMRKLLPPADGPGTAVVLKMAGRS